MFDQTLAIIRNTFFESIRQPIMLVILVVATIALIMSNSLAAFTMEDDQRMFIDMGLATVFICGALLAAFIATNVLSREIENKTALTVISKPVGRPLFVVGKFLGVGAALVVATLYMAFVFMLVEQHSVLQTVRDPIHLPVVIFGIGGGILGVIVAIWCNYFYGKVFASTVIVVTTPLMGLAYLFSLMFRHDFAFQPISEGFKPDFWLALWPLVLAILALTAIAIAASTRFRQVLTLCITLGVFLMGMLSDWIFGRPIQDLRTRWLDRADVQGLTEQVERILPALGDRLPDEQIEIVTQATVPLTDMAEGGELFLWYLCWAGRSLVPNFQSLILTDALTQGHSIPLGYIVDSTVYGVLVILGALCLAVVLFQRREVG